MTVTSKATEATEEEAGARTEKDSGATALQPEEQLLMRFLLLKKGTQGQLNLCALLLRRKELRLFQRLTLTLKFSVLLKMRPLMKKVTFCLALATQATESSARSKALKRKLIWKK